MIFNYFSGDFEKIKEKINHEKEISLEKFINEYEFNKCDTQGHLPALKEKCRNLKKKIYLYKKDTVSYLSLMIVLLVDSIDAVYKSIDIKLFTFIVFFIFFIRKI